MARAPYIPPGPKEQKAWKRRVSGVLVMLTKGCSKTGRLSHELIGEVKVKFGYKCDRTIRDIWKRYKAEVMADEPLRIQRKQGSGRKLKHLPEELQNRIRNIPLPNRRTIRSLSFHSGIPKSTLHEYLSRGLLARSTSTVKPSLTDENIQRRNDYCRGMVEADGCFNDVMADVHVDEKWFFVMRVKDKYYLLPDEVDNEELLHRHCSHKNHITKVMFGAAVARPRQNPETGEWWHGKVHISPFIQYEAAQRSSRNRPAGTIITKSINVNREVYRNWLCNDCVTAAIAQWPDWAPKHIRFQQDNAKPHIPTNDPHWLSVQAFYALPENGGWQLELRFQPPNSPDLNILDLAQFRAMQSLQQQHQTKNIDELIAVVQQCWNEFPLETSKKVWTSLQMVMNAIIAAGGRNSYKLPHMGKEKWIRENGELPLRLQCTALTHAAAAASPTPPANNHAQAEDTEGSASPTSIMHGDELTIDFHNLSLEAVAEDDLWESLGQELEWEDGAGHEEEDAVGEDVDVDGMEEAEA
jgi:hypothetical protein